MVLFFMISYFSIHSLKGCRASWNIATFESIIRLEVVMRTNKTNDEVKDSQKGKVVRESRDGRILVRAVTLVLIRCSVYT
jgi:hypothetical protein